MKKIIRFLIMGLMALVITACGLSEEKKEDSWLLTQYGDMSGNQGMFYTIQNKEKDILIIIDGGWQANADFVRGVIAEAGGTVNAWIVTHYHPDHVEVLNTILSEPEGITIETIYDSPMDRAEYVQVAKAWDSPETFADYEKLIVDFPNRKHLKRGDEFTISDLHFTVYNSYDETAKISGDIPNNASLVFKVEGPEKSVLFCADVHTNEMQQKLMELYGEELQADYLQAGHHGNNSFDNTFYDLVSPSVVFMDGPDFLVNGEEYKTKHLVNYCKEKDILYYWYNTTPNSFHLD